ncbi:hypothetical protein DYBT9623_02123 [Dyadobacter sp. CECT 9623]|uniref:Uncharacterized protein n=1 Tax=Dyadobacter linearis TaxID=2823330 RepID=A0ABM8UPS9_9BACT|nr:hypothetical protein [Dyadobacter sp. CECT 9623]CAG5069387.1 hypothetical protein DYBT9623_02123 [Dyadobacter sp. CECT 9623]
MEFVYRYYYTCFYLHQKTKGMPPDLAWARALQQIAAGLWCLYFGLLISISVLLDKVDSVKGGNGFLVVATGFIPAFFLYYFLFNVYEVCKETGRTPRSDFEITVGWKRFFWCSWLAAAIFPFIIGL